MEGQYSFNFVTQSSGGITHDILCEHCKHRGWLKGATETEDAMWMCGYANKKDAKCWDDWIPCTENNCPLIE